MSKKTNDFELTINQLCIAFKMGRATVEKRIKHVEPYGRKGAGVTYHLRDVTTLIDGRELTSQITNANNQHTNIIEEDDENPTDPLKMTPVQRINHYRAEDLKEASILKKRKNDVECGRLMVAEQVERTTAEAFKKIALTLDTLPDLLERDGIISSSDISKVISLLDSSREQLAVDLSRISLSVDEINERGEW